MALLDPRPRLLMREDEEFASGDGIENAHADIIGRQHGGLPCLGGIGTWPFVRSAQSRRTPPRRGMKRGSDEGGAEHGSADGATFEIQRQRFRQSDDGYLVMA